MKPRVNEIRGNLSMNGHLPGQYRHDEGYFVGPQQF